jgi:hypothetical protein
VQREVPGFGNITGVSYYDDLLKGSAESQGYELKVTLMPPSEYLDQVANMQCSDVAMQREIVMQEEITTQSLVGQYAEMMSRGIRFDILYLDYTRGTQEGRTRALAAKKLGYKEVPVLLVSEG